MWETILEWATRLKSHALRKVGRKHMTTKEIQEKFAPLYEKATDDEAVLQGLITAYATGGDVRLADIDEVFKRMKGNLKEIRSLALEYKEEHQ